MLESVVNMKLDVKKWASTTNRWKTRNLRCLWRKSFKKESCRQTNHRVSFLLWCGTTQTLGTPCRSSGKTPFLRTWSGLKSKENQGQTLWTSRFPEIIWWFIGRTLWPQSKKTRSPGCNLRVPRFCSARYWWGVTELVEKYFGYFGSKHND